MSDAALTTLPRLPNLQHLNVALTAVSEAGAAKFQRDRPQVKLEFGASDERLDATLMPTSIYSTTKPASGRIVGFGSRPRMPGHLHLRGRDVTDRSMALLVA